MVLHISYGRATMGNAGANVDVFDPIEGTGEEINIGASSAPSSGVSPVESGKGVVRLMAVVACRVSIGLNPVASASSPIRMQAGQTQHCVIRNGHKVAAIEI